MMIYVNGQDIARLVVGGLQDGKWVHHPESLALRPEEYLMGLEGFLSRAKLHMSQIDGFVIVKGPGSATALRTAHSLVNALAFALKVQVISVEKSVTGSDEQIVKDFAVHKPHQFALPDYGRGPNITASKRDTLRRKSV